MKILVLNCGSSSLKYQLFDMTSETVMAKGICERIGIQGSALTHKPSGKDSCVVEKDMPDHKVAVQMVLDMLVDPVHGVIVDVKEISAVGHRVLHAAQKYIESIVVNEDVKATVRECFDFGPLHNPANAQGIEACIKVFGENVPQVVVFDTSFHSTMPQKAYMYAIPYEYYEKYGVRRYGFHGTSHRYVSTEMAKRMGKNIEDLKIITCHIGNGSSITAIDGGKVVDTTMGLTPLDGFMMGTRSGSLDPSVVTFIQEQEHLTASEMDAILNKKSGLLGISGISSDDRDITAAEEKGDEHASLAHQMLYYQIAKYIGSYYVAMGGCDAIVFTAGLGENQPKLRESVCDYLKCLGVEFDTEANEKCIRGQEGVLTTANSKIRVELIATNEELVIARDTKEIVEKM